MSTGEYQEDQSEEMSTELPSLKWPRATFDGLVQNFRFPENWGALYPEEGQTAADAPAGYITLFSDFFCEGNFRLPVTKFFLEILEYYKLHISQLHPIGTVRVRHFEFVCWTMHIEPTVPRFRVFHQIHCTQGFYSFVQRASAKNILQHPPKSFHDWKQNFFFIKAGVIRVRMVLRGKEDVPIETIQTPVDENWYQDLKDVPNIALPEKALVGASVSLNWKMDRDDQPVYTEDGHVASLYVVAFKREGGKMGTIKKKPDEELWYHKIVKNFVLPRDADLPTQPATSAGKLCAYWFTVRYLPIALMSKLFFCVFIGELSNLGVGPEKKNRATTGNVAPKKSDAERSQPSKVKNVGGEKKGMRRSSDSWCDYVVVSDSLEGLAPAVTVRRPKPEPRDTTDIPPSNPDDPIDLESSTEHLVLKKAGKRKQADAEAEGQPSKKIQRKKITRKGNLDAFVSESAPETPVSPVPTESQPVVNEELPPSPPRAPVAENLEPTKVVDGGVKKTVEVDKPVDVAVEAEKVVNIEEQGSFSGAGEHSPIRPEETLGDYYYRTYWEKDASELHVPVWNLKKGDTFSDWRVCQDWLQGIFPPGEIKFQESRSHEQTYHAYLEEAASHASTTHRIVREWHSMHKEWDAFQDAEIERLKREKADVEAALAEAHSHRERSEQREVQTCATLALRDKELEELTALLSDQEQLKKDLELARSEKTEISRCFEEKLEASETARTTIESELEPLKNDMLWLKERGIACVAESVLNSEELDKTVARLVVAARKDGYSQGYTECSQHVNSALKVDWDTSKFVTYGVNTDAALTALKAEFNDLQLPVMDLINVALQSDDHVAQLKEIFPDEGEDLA
ncbi:hypothetical protein HanLR1_Chr01g0021681 [Helianthus annuus]|nr:hypothetical protein HanLR1_Chr01g0021681 [Helianthus annuus]